MKKSRFLIGYYLFQYFFNLLGPIEIVQTGALESENNDEQILESID